MTSSRTSSYLFLLFAAFVNTLPWILPMNRTPVAMALAFDMAVTVPVAYWLLVARPRRQSVLTFAMVALLCLLRGLVVLPATASAKPLLLGLLEVSVLAFVFFRARTLRQDFPALARALETELSVFYYAFFSWRSKPEVPHGMRPVPLHEETGAHLLFMVAAAMSVVEAGVVHLVIWRYSHAAAWAMTALSIYGAVWLLAAARAFVLRPLLVDAEGFCYRKGFLVEARIEYSNIVGIEAAGGETTITLRVPVAAELPMGFTKNLTALKLPSNVASAILPSE